MAGSGHRLALFRVAVGLLVALWAYPISSFAMETSTSVEALIVQSTVTLEFPSGIRIESTIRPDRSDPDFWLELVYRIGDNETLHLASVASSPSSDGDIVSATGWLGLQEQFVPPGLAIVWQWRVVDHDGIQAISSQESTLWYDNRQPWQHVEGAYGSMHWFGLDDNFAADVLASADGTVSELNQRFGMELSTPYNLWVYPTQDAFLEAIMPNSREALAAATWPDFAVTLAVIPNGFDAEIGRVIPHEITHLVLSQVSDSAFSVVPLWFNEGLATQIQTGGTNGYLPMVSRALDEGKLFALNAIDVAFPYTAYEATLAYAASWSALRYIVETWGDAGVTDLIAAYAAGVAWDDALLHALGITMDEFEAGWNAWIGDQSIRQAA